MTPNVHSVRLKGCYLVAVLPPHSHLQIRVSTWKDAFLIIRPNDRRRGLGERGVLTVDHRGTENRDQFIDEALALLNNRKTRTDVYSSPLFAYQSTVLGSRHLRSLVI